MNEIMIQEVFGKSTHSHQFKTCLTASRLFDERLPPEPVYPSVKPSLGENTQNRDERNLSLYAPPGFVKPHSESQILEVVRLQY